MKTTRLLFVPCLLVLALVLSAGTALGQAVYAVHPVKLSLKLVIQDDNGAGGLIINKVNTGDQALVNLARNRDPDDPVPANEILVLLLDCQTGDAQLVVWDLSISDILVPVTHTFDIDDHIVVQATGGTTQKAEFVTEAEIDNSSSPTFALLGGTLVMTGSAGFKGNDCPAKVKLAVAGYLAVRITDNVGTEDIEALIMKGKAKAGAPIDFIIP